MGFLQKSVLVSTLSMVAGCASIVTGQNQSLSVETLQHKGASCKLSNDKGSWHVPETPGSVTVVRSYSDLVVACEKDTLKGSNSVKSTTKGMTFGNILAGGIIGGAVDAGTGAAYDYPSVISVALK
jgi:hypothetical protein